MGGTTVPCVDSCCAVSPSNYTLTLRPTFCFVGRVLLHSNSVQGLLAKAIGTLGDVPERLLRSGRNTSEFFCNKTYVYKEGADSDDDDDDADDDDESDEDRDDHDHEDDDDSDRNLEEDGEEDGQTGDGARRRRGRRRPCVRVFQPVVR